MTSYEDVTPILIKVCQKILINSGQSSILFFLPLYHIAVQIICRVFLVEEWEQQASTQRAPDPILCLLSLSSLGARYPSHLRISQLTHWKYPSTSTFGLVS